MAFSDVVARLSRIHGRSPIADRPISKLPHSTVLVLDTEVELRAALERAITFERNVATRTAENISRYEQMVGRGDEQMVDRGNIANLPVTGVETVVETALSDSLSEQSA